MREGARRGGGRATVHVEDVGDRVQGPRVGKVESVLVDMVAPSAAAAGALAADEEGTFLPVPRNMLRGASSQLHLSVRIDKVQD